MNKLVKSAFNWEEMDGDTSLEKMLNAYLTVQFVKNYDVSSDECLQEARDVISIVDGYGDNCDPGRALAALISAVTAFKFTEAGPGKDKA